MQLYTSSLLYYLSFALISFLFGYAYEKAQNKGLKYKYFMLLFLSVFLICSMRYYVGNDYPSYIDGFLNIQTYEENIFFWEPGYYFINRFFSFSDIGYLYVFAFSSFISFFFLFKSFLYTNTVKWGAFFAWMLGLIIFMNNGIRQGISICIFLYSIKYVEQSRFWRYLLCILFATLFHYSAIVMIFVYFIKKMRLNKTTWIILITISLVLMILKIPFKLAFLIIPHLPYYSGYIEDSTAFQAEASIGFGIIYIVVLAMIIAIYSSKINFPIYVNIYLIGSLIYISFFGIAIIQRIGQYMLFCNCITFALLIKRTHKETINKFVLLLTISYYTLQSTFALEREGAVPYRTIFNEKIESPYNNDYSQKEKYL